MMKKYLLILVAFLLGNMSAVEAKINYVPLYLVAAQADSTQTLPNTLFVTQDDHKFILPESEDSLTFMLLKDNESVKQFVVHFFFFFFIHQSKASLTRASSFF